MVGCLNFAVLVICSCLALYFYIKSVGPAALEKRIGEIAYKRCARYRVIASVFMFVMLGNYILYAVYPLPIDFPRTFPWNWWLSFMIAVVIGVPSGYLMWWAVKDAGEETMVPKKEHGMYKGIYEEIRHPQAVGELPLWWAIAFVLHSPFLALFSLLYIPAWIYMCIAEERDLVIRYGQVYEEYRKRTGFWFPRRAKMNKKSS
jgi:protein-S-isoprenylcysteine O-methyltransferase Ste14